MVFAVLVFHHLSATTQSIGFLSKQYLFNVLVDTIAGLGMKKLGHTAPQLRRGPVSIKARTYT